MSDGLIPRLAEAAGLVWQHILLHPVLQLALGSIAVIIVGSLAGRSALGSVLRWLGNLGLVAALLLTVARVLHIDTGGILPDTDESQVTVSGSETRVKLAQDGHFWVSGKINGVKTRFLVDTGATITTLSPDAASLAGLEADPYARPMVLTTANGRTTADRTNIPRLSIGTIEARNLGAVIAPGLGETNVLGMNFLSKLGSWRVEGNTLIMVPSQPGASAD